MANLVGNIMVSPARILCSPLGTTLPANTLAPGGAWPAGWVEVGYTTEPLKFSYTFEALDVFVEQHLAPVGRVKTKEELTLETVLAELLAASLDVAWDGAPDSDENSEEFTVGDWRFLTQRQWGFEGDYEDDDGDHLPIRAFVWKATASTGGELTLSKSAVMGIPLKIAALVDTSKNVKERLLKVVRVKVAV
jgi:hypothetical protein